MTASNPLFYLASRKRRPFAHDRDTFVWPTFLIFQGACSAPYLQVSRLLPMVLPPPLPRKLVSASPPHFSRQVLHTHLQDFDAAGPLYDKALKLSGENPLVQRACGLFLLSSCRFPREQSRSKGLALLSAADYRYGV